MLEDVGLLALHQLHVVGGQFEGRFLEAHVTGRGGNDEGEVDVDYVPAGVDQDVVVVPVFYGEEVLDQGVPGQALDEVGYRALPVQAEYLLVDVLQGFLA